MNQTRLWDKGIRMDPLILAFTAGNDSILDARLIEFDIMGSVAHVRALCRGGYLTDDETKKLVMALEAIGSSFVAGEWSIELEQEDGHTAIENQLSHRLGLLGGKVHLGRSRNDQILTALRLYLKGEIDSVLQRMDRLQSVLASLVAEFGSIEIPGYTHTQQAMPSSVRLWAEGFSSVLESNRQLFSAALALVDICPLGSAAGYGTPGLVLDRMFAAEQMGFSSVQDPVTACQLSRGKAEAALAFALTEVVGDLGRMAADICLFASLEFGFVVLDEDVSTGSSIMPQKRNPDVFELIRGSASQNQADLYAILALSNGLTSGYHRDLQLMKEPLFRIIDRSAAVMEAAALALGKISFDKSRAEAIATPGLRAAERAFAISIEKGVSFREAYRLVADEE